MDELLVTTVNRLPVLIYIPDFCFLIFITCPTSNDDVISLMRIIDANLHQAT